MYLKWIIKANYLSKNFILIDLNRHERSLWFTLEKVLYKKSSRITMHMGFVWHNIEGFFLLDNIPRCVKDHPGSKKIE